MSRAWRVQSDDEGEFDEIVVGKWLHVERLNAKGYFVRIGDKQWTVIAEKDGTARMVES